MQGVKLGGIHHIDEIAFDKSCLPCREQLIPLHRISSPFKPSLRSGQGIHRLLPREEELLKAARAQGGGMPGLRSLSEVEPPPGGSESSACVCDPYNGNTAGASWWGDAESLALPSQVGRVAPSPTSSSPACMSSLPRSCPMPARHPSVHPFLTSGRKVHTAKLGCRTAQSKSNGCTTPLLSLRIQQTNPGSKDHELEVGAGRAHGQEEDQLFSDAQWPRALVRPVTLLCMTVALPISPDSLSRGESLYEVGAKSSKTIPTPSRWTPHLHL